MTAKDGTFSLGDVAPGSYTREAWHEKTGTLTKKVTVKKGGAIRADLSFRAK